MTGNVGAPRFTGRGDRQDGFGRKLRSKLSVKIRLAPDPTEDIALLQKRQFTSDPSILGSGS